MSVPLGFAITWVKVTMPPLVSVDRTTVVNCVGAGETVWEPAASVTVRDNGVEAVLVTIGLENRISFFRKVARESGESIKLEHALTWKLPKWSRL